MSINFNFFRSFYRYCDTGRLNSRPLPSGYCQEFFELGELENIDAFCRKYQKEKLYFGVPREAESKNTRNFPFKPTFIGWPSDIPVEKGAAVTQNYQKGISMIDESIKEAFKLMDLEYVRPYTLRVFIQRFEDSDAEYVERRGIFKK